MCSRRSVLRLFAVNRRKYSFIDIFIAEAWEVGVSGIFSYGVSSLSSNILNYSSSHISYLYLSFPMLWQCVSQVNLNGAISFESDLPDYRSNLVLPFGVKVIAPFFADVDTRLSGNVYYRWVSNSSIHSMAYNNFWICHQMWHLQTSLIWSVINNLILLRIVQRQKCLHVAVILTFAWSNIVTPPSDKYSQELFRKHLISNSQQRVKELLFDYLC